jgi:hypothetical protein
MSKPKSYDVQKKEKVIKIIKQQVTTDFASKMNFIGVMKPNNQWFSPIKFINKRPKLKKKLPIIRRVTVPTIIEMPSSKLEENKDGGSIPITMRDVESIPHWWN